MRFQGSPGGRAQVTVTGLGQFALTEQAASTRPPQAAGWYQTTLTLPETAALTAAQVKVSLTGKDGKTVIATAPGTLTSTPAGAARVAEITAAEVGVGVNPSPTAWTTGEEPTDRLFPKLGQRLRVLGDLGDRFLVQGPSGLATAFKATLKLLPTGTPPPAAGVGLPTWQDTPNEWQLHLPISQRTPFTLEDDPAQRGKGSEPAPAHRRRGAARRQPGGQRADAQSDLGAAGRSAQAGDQLAASPELGLLRRLRQRGAGSCTCAKPRPLTRSSRSEAA